MPGISKEKVVPVGLRVVDLNPFLIRIYRVVVSMVTVGGVGKF